MYVLASVSSTLYYKFEWFGAAACWYGAAMAAHVICEPHLNSRTKAAMLVEALMLGSMLLLLMLLCRSCAGVNSTC